ncbi:C10 family peptidase [Pontiella agarivorans]|uniref:C10 family peptidase n=1 Tax=Pontiella agarivorans TaxID=3038953 RepID=A0ABU5MZT8_9BACT|nr:C10 family peptidase [Pontiella agarivorans]MDZ8119690.1 C10 family peptidase [Pontiella agarivorans]
MEKELQQPVRSSAAAAMAKGPESDTELHGPFLETVWNQCNPYNLLCPADPDGSQYYDYRAAVGCVPAAYAQVLAFHRWPVRGQGAHAYTYGDGSITGVHSVVFSDDYAWDRMQEDYDPWDTNPDPENDAIAELMYELGVAAEANYESGGTSSSTMTLGNRLGNYYYGSIDAHYSQSELITPLEADLRAGFPCIVSIPGLPL